MEMIDFYLERYQPLLCSPASSLLFPSLRGSGAMSDNGLRTALIRFVEREIGLTINPHLFRHLSALIFLRTNPGQYESVRQLLGHKNIQTTIEHYASFDNDEAMQRYTDIVTDLRHTVPGQKG